MSDQPFTKRELELLFKRLEEKMDAIIDTITDDRQHYDKRLSDVENDVKELQTFQAKAMMVWAGLSFISATIASFLLNRFL